MADIKTIAFQLAAHVVYTAVVQTGSEPLPRELADRLIELFQEHYEAALMTPVPAVAMNVVRTTSHRSRERLARLLGAVPVGYFSFTKRGDWREIPESKLQEAVKIPGVTKSKLPTDAMRYIDWGEST
jgi:hypothetical protein